MGETLLRQKEIGRSRPFIVQASEKAAEHGKEFLEDAIEVLTEHHSSVPSKTRMQAIKVILAEKQQCNIRVGLFGGTGTGKSSMINALIKQEILPCSEETASTAVPVEVSFNHSDDPDCVYQAIVEGISTADWRKELEDLYSDVREWDLAEKRDEVPDMELKEHIKETLSKIKCVYPHLQQKDDLNTTSVEELLAEPEIRKVLNMKQTIAETDEELFAKSIKPFIDASQPKGGKSADVHLWPLVKVVKLYIKADILRFMTIVDLPGSQDTSAARAAVADNYRKNLTMSCILTPAVRASSDKGAKTELLNTAHRRDMQLDGIYNSEAILFVVTKTDILMNRNKYISDHQGLQGIVSEDLARESDNSSILQELRRDHDAENVQYSKLEKKLEQLQSKANRTWPNINKILNALTPLGKKRKRDPEELSTAEISNADPKQQTNIDSYKSLVQSIAEMTKTWTRSGNILNKLKARIIARENDQRITRCRILRACISRRNEFLHDAIRADYESHRLIMGEKLTEKKVEIFSISADTCVRIVQGEPHIGIERGFSTLDDTGVPALRDTLISATWDTRLRYAQSFNKQVEGAFKSLRSWSSDIVSDYKLSATERAIVESEIEHHVQEHKQLLEDVDIKYRKAVEDLLENRIFEKLPSIAKQATRVATKETIPKWQLAKWNTFHAVNKREGIFTNSRGVAYDWNEDLAASFRELIMEDWVATFHKEVKDLHKDYDIEVDGIVKKLADDIFSSGQEFNAGLIDSLLDLQDKILVSQITLRGKSERIFNEINDLAKNTHRLAKPIALQIWKPVYEECYLDTGRNHFQRNKQKHLAHVKGDGGLAMYTEIGDRIKENLTSGYALLTSRFPDTRVEVLSQIKEDAEVFLDKHSSGGSRTSRRRVNNQSKKNLHNAFLPLYETLESAMASEPKAEEIDQQDIDEQFDNIPEEAYQKQEDSDNEFGFDFSQN